MVHSFYGPCSERREDVRRHRLFPQKRSKVDIPSSILWFPLKLEQYLIVGHG